MTAGTGGRSAEKPEQKRREEPAADRLPYLARLWGWRKMLLVLGVDLIVLGLVLAGRIDTGDQHVCVAVIDYYLWTTVAALGSNGLEHVGKGLADYAQRIKGMKT